MSHVPRLAGIIILSVVLVAGFGSDRTAEEDVRAEPAGSAARGRPPKSGPAPAVAGTVVPLPSRPPTPAPAAGPAAPGVPGASAAGPGRASAEALRVKADELGEVPVLMYHRIVARPTASLDRTPQQLRAELTRLAREGYVPVTAAEFVEGRLDIPAGRHPVVLTFDDGTPGHFGLDEHGVPPADTAVGILLDVAAAHPGFRPVATFYVNRSPFALGTRTAEGVRWLVRHGFEVANHTANHKDLSRLSRTGVRNEIAGLEKEIVALTGAHSTTLAYPFGAIPDQPSAARSSKGQFAFKGIFLAGWRPSVSPFDRAFDPFEITRIRSEGRIAENDCRRFCSAAWLDRLADHPEQRYTSDGDPGVITVPAAKRGELGARFRGLVRVY